VIDFALIAALVLVLLYALTQRRRASRVALGMGVLSVVGLGLVLAPGIANDVAASVGLARGADLILYCFVALVLAAVLNVHLRLRAEHETTTELARTIALMSARQPQARSKESADPGI
jgi:hypothetical protein